jgi:hypothetical protein
VRNAEWLHLKSGGLRIHVAADHHQHLHSRCFGAGRVQTLQGAELSATESPGSTDGLPAISWLVGTWVGLGVGDYPTIEAFRFAQEVSFATDGRPMLSYSSRSWLLDDDGIRIRPLAAESGFWRLRPENRLEVLISHPTGYSEVWIGEVTVNAIEGLAVTGAKIELQTDVVARTESAKDYSAGTRIYGLVDGDLLWAFDMAAVGQPLQPHLSARLVRV